MGPTPEEQEIPMVNPTKSADISNSISTSSNKKSEIGFCNNKRHSISKRKMRPFQSSRQEPVRKDLLHIIKRLIKILEESSLKISRTPVDIAVTEIELTDIAVKILGVINPALVNFKLIPHMEDVKYAG